MIDVKLDLGGVDKAFADIRHSAKHLREVFRNSRKDITIHIRDHFVKREGAFGSWAPRAQSSIERIAGRRMRVQGGTLSSREYRARGGWMKRTKVTGKRFKYRMANQLGRLKYAFKYTATETYLEIASIIPWAGIHQEGGRAGKGGRVPIPARPFLWVSDEIIAALGREVLQVISRRFLKY